MSLPFIQKDYFMYIWWKMLNKLTSAPPEFLVLLVKAVHTSRWSWQPPAFMCLHEKSQGTWRLEVEASSIKTCWSNPECKCEKHQTLYITRQAILAQGFPSFSRLWLNKCQLHSKYKEKTVISTQHQFSQCMWVWIRTHSYAHTHTHKYMQTHFWKRNSKGGTWTSKNMWCVKNIHLLSDSLL